MRQVRSSLTLKNKRKNNENLRVDFTVALGYSISVREDNGNIYYSLGDMFDKVKAIFEEQLGVSQDEMKLDTNFKDDLGVDSLDLYEIVMKLEDEFDVEIPAEELDDVATFEDVLNYLKSKGVEE